MKQLSKGSDRAKSYKKFGNREQTFSHLVRREASASKSSHIQLDVRVGVLAEGGLCIYFWSDCTDKLTQFKTATQHPLCTGKVHPGLSFCETVFKTN